MRAVLLLVVMVAVVVGLGLWFAFRPVPAPSLSGEESTSGPAAPVAPEVAPVAPAEKTAAGPGSGTVAGKVVLFRDRSPVKDVVVHLGGGPEGFEGLDEISDAEGIFRFAKVPAGKGYQLQIRHGEYAPVLRLDLVVVQGDETDVGTLFLEKAVTLKVKVLDGARTPIGKATVGVYAATPPTYGWNPGSWIERTLKAAEVPTALRTVQTDEKGEATIGELAPGFYSVAADAAGYGRGGAERLLSPDTESEPLEILLGRGVSLTGHVKGVDDKPVKGSVVLSPQGAGYRWGQAFLRRSVPIAEDGAYEAGGLTPGNWVLLVVREGSPPWPGGSVSIPPITNYDIDLGAGTGLAGTVKNEKGEPVPGAELRALVYPHRGGQAFGALAVSGEDGAYHLEGLPAGTLGSLEVICEGYARYPPPNSIRESIPLASGSTAHLDVVLPKGVEVTGTITVNPDGKPVSGAKVSAIPRGAWGSSSWDQAVTDEEGHYRFAALAPGEYGLQVEGGGSCQPDFPDPWRVRSGRGKIDDRWLLKVEIGATKITKDLVLESGATVSGRVEDTDGKPVAGAMISISNQRQGTPEISDENGKFRVDGVEAADQVLVYAWLTGRWGRSDRFHVGAGTTVDGIVVRLTSAGGVKGSVEIADGGAPDGGTVRAVQGDPRRNPWLLRQSGAAQNPIGPDGTFSLENVPPGQVCVIAEVPGYPIAYSEAFSLPEGASRTGVLIRIEAGLKIDGVVVDEEGKPLAGAEISVMNRQGIGYFGPGNSQTTVAQTGEDGKFVVSGLAAGKYTVRAQKEDLIPATEQNVEAGQGSNLRLSLVAGTEVSGQVFDADGIPLGDIRVSLKRSDGKGVAGANLQATTQPDGTFKITGVPDGQYKLTAGPSYASKLNYTTEVREGVNAGDTGVRIRLMRGYPISGRVVEADGSPAVGLRVWARATSPQVPNSSRQAQTEADGTFEIQGLPEGTYSLGVQARGENAPLYLNNVPAGTTNLTLSLSEAVTIEGYVYGPDGVPATGVSIQVVPMEGMSGSNGWSNTNNEGHYLVRNLASGTYQLTMMAPGRYATVVVRDVMAPSAGVNVTMPKGLEISGVVVDPNGQPATRLQIVASPVAGGPSVAGAVQKEGKFVVKALAEGDYRLSVQGSADGYILHPAPVVKAGKADLSLRLIRGLSISGRVVDENGGGVSNCYVMISGGYSSWHQADDTGGFRFDGLAPGDYKIRTWFNGRSIERSVRAGEAGVELRMAP